MRRPEEASASWGELQQVLQQGKTARLNLGTHGSLERPFAILSRLPFGLPCGTLYTHAGKLPNVPDDI